MYIDVLKKSELDENHIPVAYVCKDGEPTNMLVCVNIDIYNKSKSPRKLEIDSDDKNTEFRPYFWKNPKEVQSTRILIYGPQGSGKSYLAGQILDELFENRESKDIFIYARNDEDKPLDRDRTCCCDFNEIIDEKKLNRMIKKAEDGKEVEIEIPKKYMHEKGKKYKPIRLNPYEFGNQGCPVESYKDSIMLFDDVESMKTKDATEYLHELRCSALTVGRKLNIDSINILHNIKGGVRIATLRDESNFVFFNPNASGESKVRAFLRDYCAMGKSDIEKAMGMIGRFICVRTEFPRCLIGLKEIILI